MPEIHMGLQWEMSLEELPGADIEEKPREEALSSS